jgi:hypothetical protein
LSNAAEKRQQAKSNKRKKSLSVDNVNKENVLTKTKKAKKAEKPKSKQKVYYKQYIHTMIYTIKVYGQQGALDITKTEFNVTT